MRIVLEEYEEGASDVFVAGIDQTHTDLLVFSLVGHENSDGLTQSAVWRIFAFVSARAAPRRQSKATRLPATIVGTHMCVCVLIAQPLSQLYQRLLLALAIRLTSLLCLLFHHVCGVLAIDSVGGLEMCAQSGWVQCLYNLLMLFRAEFGRGCVAVLERIPQISSMQTMCSSLLTTC